MEKKETKLQEQLRKALEGDKKADNFLAVKSQCVRYRSAKTVTWESLCNDYHVCCVQLCAACNLNMEAIKIQTETSMAYLVWIARHQFHSDFDVKALKAKKREIMEAMLIMSRDIPPTKMQRYYHQLSSSSEEENTSAKKSANTQKRKIQSSSESELETPPLRRRGAATRKQAREEAESTSRDVPDEGGVATAIAVARAVATAEGQDEGAVATATAEAIAVATAQGETQEKKRPPQEIPLPCSWVLLPRRRSQEAFQTSTPQERRH